MDANETLNQALGIAYASISKSEVQYAVTDSDSFEGEINLVNSMAYWRQIKVYTLYPKISDLPLFQLRMAGHIIRMPPGRPANQAMSWTPRGSGRRRGHPTKTWRSTFKKDLVDRVVDWNSVRAVATNRSRWRTFAAHCHVKDRRI